MKWLGEKLFEKWIAIPREIRIISLFVIVSITFFIMFFLPGIKAVQALFIDFNSIDKVSLIVAVVSSILILVILKNVFARKK
ncbi:hypothetical protein M3215_03700 [Bacillus cytotoxicus]|uniref:Uncharacterized protein n=1 Tax=Bacillus cytotoxicus TaxID=580165 RepID=A0ACC6A3A9_9BACI|nr:hypothetical protein [Bacillus cytotoxicus]